MNQFILKSVMVASTQLNYRQPLITPRLRVYYRGFESCVAVIPAGIRGY